LNARTRASNDDGFSLVELMIAMSIFAVFITVLLASIVGITRASTQAQVVAHNSSTVLAVFQDFDHQVRYADSINFPGTGASGARYVEYRVPATSSSTSSTLCGQWKYTPSTGKLQFRQWQDGATPSTTFSTKLTGVKGAVTASYPFKLTPASDTVPNQLLNVSINAGTSATSPDATISTQFLARNSDTYSPSNNQTVTAGVSDTPVCSALANRP
jgi:prepilin-type N-terminal cleavage/methylation domain-containing protein